MNRNSIGENTRTVPAPLDEQQPLFMLGAAWRAFRNRPFARFGIVLLCLCAAIAAVVFWLSMYRF